MPESFQNGCHEGVIFLTASVDAVQFIACLEDEDAVAKGKANKRLRHGFQVPSVSREHQAFTMGRSESKATTEVAQASPSVTARRQTGNWWGVF